MNKFKWQDVFSLNKSKTKQNKKLLQGNDQMAGATHGLLTHRFAHRVQLLLLLLSHFSRVRLCATPQTADHQAPRPWDSPGKNTGVGCHFLLQCMKVKSESEVAQSCPTLRDPIDRSLPGCSVHGIFQAGVLEWGAIAFSSVLPYLLIFHFSYSIFLFSTTISSFLFYFFQFFIKL